MGYAESHDEDFYRMRRPGANRAHETWDVEWYHRTYFTVAEERELWATVCVPESKVYSLNQWIRGMENQSEHFRSRRAF